MRLRLAQGIVAVLGLGVSGYLSVERIMGSDPTCVIGGSCATVQASDYAELAGLPVAYLGVLAYALLLASALIPGLPGRMLALVVGIGSALFSLWLTVVEIWIIHAICPWCVASAVLMVTSLVIATLRVVRAGDLRA